jgi:indole-3-glycerol phosphate synthase
MTARTTGTILDRIVADRRMRLAEDRAARSEADLRALIEAARPVVSFSDRLRTGRTAGPAGAQLRLVAEIKRASPSKGVFDADLDAVAQARDYAAAGAAAISVLTEPDHFKGAIDDLAVVSAEFQGDPDRPALLRKDFIFDPYQVLEARAFGADALLLIVMLLEPDGLRDLLALTRSLGMEALIEVHDEDELAEAVAAGATVIGVNNRDLRTFAEDLGTFERLAALAPEGVTLVAESAIRAPEDARRMAAAGAHALLVGEALVRSGTVVETARSFMLADVESSEVTS